MNSGIENSEHPSIVYYDSDYPTENYGKFKVNFDKITEKQSLHDNEYYLQAIDAFGSCKIIELCCGTGRLTLPLAERKIKITAVDFCNPLLDRLISKAREHKLTDYIATYCQDITCLSLEEKNFDLAICAFNSFLCITEFDLQMKAIKTISDHLKPNGILILDLINPFRAIAMTDAIPKPFYTRINENNGNYYTRFAATGIMDISQKQELFGWYDEIDERGYLKRSHYSMYWRPVFYSELKLMLEKNMLHILKSEGGHKGEQFDRNSNKMIITAEKRSY